MYDGGFVTAVQTELPGGLLRTVRALGRAWTESFTWDAKGLLTSIDGVSVRYDDRAARRCCRDEAGAWHYATRAPT